MASWTPEKRRERYRTDPEYRQRILDRQRADRDVTNIKRRRRYASDPEYRELCIARARAYNQRKREG